MNALIPPAIMFTVTHPDAVETASTGRPTGRAGRYRELGWWTSQKSRSSVTAKGTEREEGRSYLPARWTALQAEAGKC